MSKLDNIEKDLMEIKSTLQKKKKKFRLPFRAKRLMKQERRKPNHVLVQYLTRKYQIKFLLQPVVSGNLVVVNNKVHVLNPKTVFRYGKSMWYIIREIDRKPVSNLDYNKVVKRRDDTEADIPLIKAVLGAVQKKPLAEKKTLIIVIILLVVVAVILYMIFGG